MTWSAGNTNINTSGSLAKASAAAAMAGAVLRPIGSNIIDFGVILSALNCSATINRWSLPQTTIGESISAQLDNRFKVSCNIESSETKGNSCLGKAARDIGHRRVPEPPDNTIGTIFNIN